MLVWREANEETETSVGFDDMNDVWSEPAEI